MLPQARLGQGGSVSPTLLSSSLPKLVCDALDRASSDARARALFGRAAATARWPSRRSGV